MITLDEDYQHCYCGRELWDPISRELSLVDYDDGYGICPDCGAGHTVKEA